MKPYGKHNMLTRNIWNIYNNNFTRNGKYETSTIKVCILFLHKAKENSAMQLSWKEHWQARI